jgi:cobalt-zinc-cadmium efflux system membrane fusion protein
MKNIIIILTLVACWACGSKPATEQVSETKKTDENTVTLTAAQRKNTEIVTGNLERKNISSIIKLNGKIDVPPQNMVSVSMPLGGYLKSSKLLPGMFVRKGEIIATMEDQQYIQLQQDYLINQSKLIFVEKEYQRQKELNQSQASSDKVFQQAESEYRILKINLSALAEKLKLININPKTLTEGSLSKSVHIYSAINGFVSKVNVNIGKYVNPSDILFELVNPTDIHLNLSVFEKDLNKLSIGQKVIAYTNNQPNKKHLCEIILISKDLSPEHIADVHCHFENYDKNLLPGMYMNAEIEVKNNSALTLPEDAVVSFEGKEYIFVEDKANQFSMIEVRVGNKEDRFIEILNGEAFTNKLIVTKGAYTLLMKMKNMAEEE